MSRTFTTQHLLSILLLAGALSAPARAQDEFSYRDLVPRSAGSSGPLIPQAAQALPPRPTLSRAESFQVPATPQRDLMPIATASGSQAARIYNRNKRRVGTINGIFQRLKDQARAREEALRQRQEEIARRQREAEIRAQEEKLQQEREARERATELARREEEARRRIEEANRRQDEMRQAQVRAATPPPIAQSGGGSAMASSYVVKPGDSLIKISRTLYGSSKGWTKIAAANGLDRNATIRVGDSLIIPNWSKPAPRKGRAGIRDAAESEPVLDYSKFDYKLYNIQPGDTLSGIASKFYGDSQKYQLIEAYNSKALARGLRHGDKLLIPIQRSQAHKDRYDRLVDEGVF